MPLRLPDADSLGQRPLPSALAPVVREDTGVVHRANAKLGQEVTALAEDVFKRDAEREVSEYRTRLNQLEIERLYDPEKGFINKRGKDAINGYESFSDQMAKAISDEGGKLKNPMARRAAAEIGASRRQQVQGWISNHVGREREKYDGAVLESEQATSRQRTALNPSSAQKEADLAGLSARTYAARRGLPTEAAEAAARSGIHAAAIDGYIANQNYSMARDHFAKFGDQIVGADNAKYQKAVLEAGLRHDSQVEADRIFGKAKSESEALAAARAIKSPELRDATELRLRHRYNDEAAAAKDANDKAESAVYAMIANGAKSRADIPVPTWNAMDGKSQETARAYMEKVANGEAIVTNREVYAALDDMAGDPSSGFADIDLNRYSPHLSSGDFKHFSDLKRRISSGELPGYLSQRTVREDFVTDVVGKATKGNKADDMRRRFEEAVTADREATGKKPDPTRLQQIRQMLLKEVVLKPGSLWDTKERVIDINYEDIDAETVKDAEAYLRSKGRTVSEQAVVELYIRQLQRERQGAGK